MPAWKFVTNHTLVLNLIAQQPCITVREISLSINVTEKTTLMIISDLIAGGYLSKKREGRGLRYCLNPSLPLRTGQQSADIGDLLVILGWQRPVGHVRTDTL